MEKMMFEFREAVNKYKIFIKCDDECGRCCRCDCNVLADIYTDGIQRACMSCAVYTNKLYKESVYFLKTGRHLD